MTKGKKGFQKGAENPEYGKSHKGELNSNWKGDDVGIDQLHFWVRRQLPKPDLCEICRVAPPYDLANNGTYDRNLDNWQWLCRSCHVWSDGRIKNLKQFQEGNK